MKNIRIFIAVMTLALVASWSAQAQTLTTLFSFCNDTNVCPNGSDPSGFIKGTDGNFYGTTSSGGTNGNGTIFKITPQGTLTTIFVEPTNTTFSFSSRDLSLESGGLIYGTTFTGGTNNFGTVFTITPAGTLTTLYQFSGPDGRAPLHLVQGPSANNFIGTTAIGGTNDAGTVFLITSAGTLTTLHQFSGTNTVVNDGIGPEILLVDGANFVGTTGAGGTNNDGVAFEITSQGTFTMIHEFNDVDGAEPIILIKSGANFIGTTILGGSNGVGSAFEMTSAGTVTTFYQFSGTNGVMDGSGGGLAPVQNSAGAFYGANHDGGTNSAGMIFTLTTSGTLTPVYEFCSLSACLDGSGPGSFALGNDGNAYGTTDSGGANDGGTIFKLDINSSGGGGGGCTFELSSGSATPTAAGGNATVGVVASNGCAWTAVSNDGFITITSGSSGSGNGTVHYSVAANDTTNAVVGTMTIAGNTFTVTQAAAAAPGQCTFTLKPTLITLTDKGGKKSVSIKAVGTDCAWTAVSNDPFITISGATNGTGNGKVEIIVGDNTNTTALSGTLTIPGETVTVNQAVGGCTFKLSPKAAKLKSTGGVKTVKVNPNFTNCTWTAFSNDGFITITGGTNGVGKGVVTFSVSTNSTTNVLSGTMTIAGQTYTVTQTGVKPPKD